MSFFNNIGRSMGIPSRSKMRYVPPPSSSLERPYGTPPPSMVSGSVPGGAVVAGGSMNLASMPTKPLYLCQPFVRSTLIKGSFRTIVALPNL
ncbi:hypothetical protein MGL_2435 [Malassezia globosa CBS 7966]|uniref:Uncharacterized protein n=1 Tax=Malassezia globosa (strain ATCC MYA-4612 / CBS 7966) TaxID=425265 RepID=A8Q3K9_MALGO|nr:uncharacterized protein MGL_2435 [Malassezia globosa CBS 7966]EDP43425.1 hypothetical protein MGL_2435 [Malassezia globosa CBS 7966]